MFYLGDRWDDIPISRKEESERMKKLKLSLLILNMALAYTLFISVLILAVVNPEYLTELCEQAFMFENLDIGRVKWAFIVMSSIGIVILFCLPLLSEAEE